MNTLLLLPTYNERENIRNIVPKIFASVPDARVMIIDDHSPDGTADVARDLQKRFPNLILYERQKKEGLGRAYADAFQKILREYRDVEAVCMMDADLSHDPLAIPNMLEVLRTNDLVIGSRYIRGGKLEGWEWHRRLLSRLGNAYVRMVTKIPIRDSTGGFNCMRTSALSRINIDELDASGYAFIIEMKYALAATGARIAEYPITFRNRAEGESKITMNIIEEGLFLPWKLLKKRRGSTLISCPQCKTLSGARWFEKNACSVCRCSSCGLLFLHPAPNNTSRIYAQEYFCGAHDGYGYVNYDEEKTHEKTFGRYLDLIETNRPEKGSLLDIGAATGTFLLAAKKRGWNATGVEISEYATTIAKGKGLDVRTGSLESQSFAPASFDVVTLWDVFEHLADPDLTLETIHRLLSPNGIIALNTPNAGSAYAKIMGKRWPLIIPPEHIHLFNKKNIRTALERHGFSFEAITYVGKSYTPAYIFQLLFTLHHRRFWKTLSDWIRNTPFNTLEIPIHLYDNMFILARKNTYDKEQTKINN